MIIRVVEEIDTSEMLKQAHEYELSLSAHPLSNMAATDVERIRKFRERSPLYVVRLVNELLKSEQEVTRLRGLIAQWEQSSRPHQNLDQNEKLREEQPWWRGDAKPPGSRPDWK